MFLKNCKWERQRFTGVDKYGVTVEMDEYQVVNANELKKELGPDGRDVQFSLQLLSNGLRSSLWDWNFPSTEKDEEDTSDYTAPCPHEWVNAGFTSVQMVCKYCDQDAPGWVQRQNDPQA